jgi:hypothetical protein
MKWGVLLCKLLMRAPTEILNCVPADDALFRVVLFGFPDSEQTFSLNPRSVAKTLTLREKVFEQ